MLADWFNEETVRHHDERFAALMDRHLPKWRATKRLLNAGTLGLAEWGSEAPVTASIATSRTTALRPSAIGGIPVTSSH
jgi:hypothetical protein